MGNRFSSAANAATDEIPPALAAIFESKNCDPFTGLRYPLEATRLIIRVDSKLALAWTTRGEWSLIGGISKSRAPGDTRLTDFRPPVDPRYLTPDGTQQLAPADQERIKVESPLRGLMREAEEELTRDWSSQDAQISRDYRLPDGAEEINVSGLAWFLDRIREGRWTSVVATKHRPPITRYSTYLCLALIDLTSVELAALNATIAQYGSREMIRFEAFDYQVSNAGGRDTITVSVPAGQRIRHYDAAVTFSDYAAAILRLLSPK